MKRPPPLLLLVAGLLVPVAVAGCTSSTRAAAGPSTAVTVATSPRAVGSPTGSASPTDPGSARSAQVSKLLTVVVENHSLDQMSAGMPYLNSLAQRFAYATGYTAIGHPSLPNYLAIAAGSTFGVSDDGAPSRHPLNGPTVFDQALAAGRTAATYAESMPGNCAATASNPYAVKHNPWAYFTDAGPRANCESHDVPAGQPSQGRLASDAASGRLPNAGLWIPNLCHDAHDCPLNVADDYLKGWLPEIMAGPDYRSGRLAIVVTADEDDNAAENRVLTVVLHTSLDQTHTVVTAALTHYSLTLLYDQIIGAPPLREAASAVDMRAAFRLP